MAKMLSSCPVCGEKLSVSVLHCASCGLDLKNDFELSPFDSLDKEQSNFLITFLKLRGNLRSLQAELNLSYPAAKKKYEELLYALNISPADEENVDMNTIIVDRNSSDAAEIVKRKLIDAGGRATVYSLQGKPYVIRAGADGKTFLCDALPVTPPYEYSVFNVIVELLKTSGGKAPKGMGRGKENKLGGINCEEYTVVGAIAKNYAGKKDGESVYDPVFVLAAVLDWAGIAHNDRGYIQLTNSYMEEGL